jgi:hypothetical protein
MGGMAKRRVRWTKESIERRLAEGWGDGTGINYQQWLRVQDVPSKGRIHRIKGCKTGRVHHLLSDLEAKVFYAFDFSLSVIDIREQFPLLPLEDTLAIAEECGVPHPTDPRTKHPVVMTTDLLVTKWSIHQVFCKIRGGSGDCRWRSNYEHLQR